MESSKNPGKWTLLENELYISSTYSLKTSMSSVCMPRAEYTLKRNLRLLYVFTSTCSIDSTQAKWDACLMKTCKLSNWKWKMNFKAFAEPTDKVWDIYDGHQTSRGQLAFFSFHLSIKIPPWCVYVQGV